MIENSKRRHHEGFSIHQRIMKLKKLTGGMIFKAGESELRMSVLKKKCSDERKIFLISLLLHRSKEAIKVKKTVGIML